MNQKTIAAFAAVGLAAGALLSGCGRSETDTAARKPGTLHIYTWSDYIAPEVLKGFEAKFNCKVVVDTFESNEAMYAKLKAGGTGYDIITPSSYQIGLMAKEGMILELDHSRIPNVRRNFDPSFAKQIIDPTFRYNVPYAVTYTGFMYAKKKVPAGVDVASWSVLSNPAFKGRVTLLDDLREVIGAGLMSLGYSINSTNPAEIEKAVEQVLKWRANIRKFDAESYKTEVPSGATYIGQGYSTDSTQVIIGDEEEGAAPRPDIGFVLPKEGFTIAFDEMVIAKDAPARDLAYAFINYVYDGDVAKANMEFLCGPTPVKPGIEKLDPAYRRQIVLDEKTLAKGQLLRGFEGQPEINALYNKAWDRIKATDERK